RVRGDEYRGTRATRVGGHTPRGACTGVATRGRTLDATPRGGRGLDHTRSGLRPGEGRTRNGHGRRHLSRSRRTTHPSPGRGARLRGIPLVLCPTPSRGRGLGYRALQLPADPVDQIRGPCPRTGQRGDTQTRSTHCRLWRGNVTANLRGSGTSRRVVATRSRRRGRRRRRRGRSRG